MRPMKILELRDADGPGGGPEKTILHGAGLADTSRFDITVCYLRRQWIRIRRSRRGLPSWVLITPNYGNQAGGIAVCGAIFGSSSNGNDLISCIRTTTNLISTI